jgi:hypothetical protein
VSGAEVNVNSGVMKSLESAQAVVTVLVDVLVPTGYIRFAPDGVYPSASLLSSVCNACIPM